MKIIGLVLLFLQLINGFLSLYKLLKRKPVKSEKRYIIIVIVFITKKAPTDKIGKH